MLATPYPSARNVTPFLMTATAAPGIRRVRQDNLATAHNKIGDALRAQSTLPDALESYHAALAVRERLANAKPEPAESQSKVAAALNNIGDVLKEQGKVKEALETYRASLAKVDPIAKGSPDSAARQQDLAFALGNICVTTGQHGQFDVGLADCERALVVARTRLAPDRTDYKKLLIDFETLLPNYRIETARAYNARVGCPRGGGAGQNPGGRRALTLTCAEKSHRRDEPRPCAHVSRTRARGPCALPCAQGQAAPRQRPAFHSHIGRAAFTCSATPMRPGFISMVSWTRSR
jgi:tetratricopeptide (TPR) repeat protein